MNLVPINSKSWLLNTQNFRRIVTHGSTFENSSRVFRLIDSEELFYIITNPHSEQRVANFELPQLGHAEKTRKIENRLKAPIVFWVALIFVFTQLSAGLKNSASAPTIAPTDTKRHELLSFLYNAQRDLSTSEMLPQHPASPGAIETEKEFSTPHPHKVGKTKSRLKSKNALPGAEIQKFLPKERI